MISVFSENMDGPHYWTFGLFMLYLTYVYNKIFPFKLTFYNIIVLTTPTSILLWWVAYKYNDFLSLDPIDDNVFLVISGIYSYLIIFILSNKKYF